MKPPRLNHALALFLPLLLLGVSVRCIAEQSEFEKTESISPLAATIMRYFASSKNYQRGDLITNSQVAEMQGFLRKTQGHSPATHPRMLRRLLSDNAALVKFFYSGDNRVFLRNAAKKYGGYAGLDRITQSAAGREKLEALQRTNDIEGLETLLKDFPLNRSAKRPPRIYTVEEFLAALSGPDDATPAPTDARKEPVSK
jgi:hypothetical protein